MFTRLAFLQKVPNMTREHFNSFWRLVHGPGALWLNGLQYYHQNVVTSVAGTGNPVLPLIPLDGIAQLGWRDKYSMYDATYKSSRRRNVADVQLERQHFIGWQRTFLCEREDNAEGNPALDRAHKAFLFLGRDQRLTGQQFHSEWTKAREDLLASSGILSSVRSIIVDRMPVLDRSGTYEEMPFDEVEEIWFDTEASLEGVLGSAARLRDSYSTALRDVAIVTATVTRFVA